MKPRLTISIVERATAKGKSSRYLGDGGCLYLRVLRSGAKIWVFRTKYEGTTMWGVLGSYPRMTLKVARRCAVTLRQQCSDKKHEMKLKKLYTGETS